MKTKLGKPGHAGEEWDYALKHGRMFRIHHPTNDRIYFDVLLLGQADYVAVNLNSKGEYDPEGSLQLLSVNGDFRYWVEEGCQGRIQGVRWPVRCEEGRWKILGDVLAPLAIEKVMGELVNERGEVVGVG